MRPCGPVPEIADRSRPASLARRRASGEDAIRPAPLAFAAGAAGAAEATGAAAAGADGVGHLKRGFLGGPAPPTLPATSSPPGQRVAPAAGDRMQSSNGVTTDGFRPTKWHHSSKPAAAPKPAPAAAAGLERASLAPSGPSKLQGQAEEAVPDLQDVFDSSPTDAAIRAARAAWLRLPPAARSRWAQTSSEVSAWFALPEGTRAAELRVEIGPAHLRVRLNWYGTLAEGSLHGRVVAAEARWCVEDANLHLMLPKGSAGGTWRALLQGVPKGTLQR